MKKLFAGILFVALLTAAAGTAFAGGHGRGHHRNSSCYYSGSCNYTCGRDVMRTRTMTESAITRTNGCLELRFSQAPPWRPRKVMPPDGTVQYIRNRKQSD